MTRPDTELSDTASWLPLDGLAPGFDANRAEFSDQLLGREFTLLDADQRATGYRCGPDRVFLSPAGGPETSYRYEAFDVAEGLYYVQLDCGSRLVEGTAGSISLFLDTFAGRALTVVSQLGEAGSRPRLRQLFSTAIIDDAGIPAGIEPAPTSSLIGRRVLWEYSTAHAYEHLYLSPHWYTWQCLAGPERGLADTDECSTYELRPGIYVFTWREKVIPCAAVTIADHRDVRNLRSHGMLYGLDATGEAALQFTFGAYGRLLSSTVHPEQFDPAR
ncbi:MAG: molybdenum cofactor biosynthesis F family protein [Actinomycetota bacterium]|nr:molybdenum cofactor biosynthesis F family protein [Actinomycetota bacterium]MDQ2955768.1 molybdenum cofactor biosynthesis F family protein [Actinomycetota bacterium]